MTDRAQQLAEAMEAARLNAPSFSYFPYVPWWAVSTLRPTKPPQRPQNAISRDIVPDPNPGEASAVALTEPPVPIEVLSTGRNNPQPRPPGAEVEPVWRALLDIRVWRGRWWWRLAASLVVKRPRS